MHLILIVLIGRELANWLSLCVHQVLLNDSDVTANVSNKQSLTVPPLSSTMLTVGLLAPVTPGNLYTVVLQYAESGAAESVAGGRVAKTHFPIEAWPKSKECPFPTVKDNNYKVIVYKLEGTRSL